MLSIYLHSVSRLLEILSDSDLVNLLYWYGIVPIVVVKFVICNIATAQET